MLTEQEILITNQNTFQGMYSRKECFLRYPADWIIRFHNIYLKKHVSSGRVLDFGCGGGNNSIFFLDKGYDVYGVEVVPAAKALIKENLHSRQYDSKLSEQFSILDLNWASLPYENEFFDVIVANQVLYYYPTKERIQKVCKEFLRCLCPGGVVFITMMSPRNNFVKDYVKSIKENVVDVEVDDPNDRLFGIREIIYLVDSENELRDLFCDFQCLNIGFFETSLFDLSSTHHWIFVGKKEKQGETSIWN